MEKDIFELIRSLVDFDGDEYSLFEKGKDIIRVNITDGNVIVHALDMNDVTEFHYFRNLPKSIQIEIYNDIPRPAIVADMSIRA